MAEIYAPSISAQEAIGNLLTETYSASVNAETEDQFGEALMRGLIRAGHVGWSDILAILVEEGVLTSEEASAYASKSPYASPKIELKVNKTEGESYAKVGFGEA